MYTYLNTDNCIVYIPISISGNIYGCISVLPIFMMSSIYSELYYLLSYLYPNTKYYDINGWMDGWMDGCIVGYIGW